VRLLDDLRNLLRHHLDHAIAQTNSGTARLIEDHLNRLAAVGPDLVEAEAAVHKVLAELYAALNAPAPAEPATTDQAPAIVGESGPELADLPEAAEAAAAKPAAKKTTV
jgi:hypothetical protein